MSNYFDSVFQMTGKVAGFLCHLSSSSGIGEVEDDGNPVSSGKRPLKTEMVNWRATLTIGNSWITSIN